ncbi:MAG: dephospho-CoA kinase [Scrofimicrobium sp.]
MGALESGETLRVGLAAAQVLSLPRAVGDTHLKHNDRLYLGLTGGIGSGKSSLSVGMEQAGAVVISADDLAREIVLPGSVALAQIAEAFGSQVLSADGSLDRPALGELVFSDPEARVRLERITHPQIAREAEARVVSTPANSVVVYDVPLLVENQMADQFDLVIVVDAPVHQRLERLETRGVSRIDALSRIDAQANDAQRRAVANIWVENDGTHADLHELASQMLREWLCPILDEA